MQLILSLVMLFRPDRARSAKGTITEAADALTDDELAAIDSRVHATTPGPWASYFEGRDLTASDSFIGTATQDLYLSAEDYAGGGGHFCADLDFIKHARQDVPRLIAEIRRLRGGRVERGSARR